MSNNPFESPYQEPIQADAVSHGNATQALPGPAMAISIICLILGIVGLFSTCSQGLVLSFQSALIEFSESVPQQPGQKEFNHMNLAANQSMQIPGIVLMVVNLFVAGLLIAGSIGCLKRKSSGRSLLRLGLLAAIFFLLLRLVFLVISYFVVKGSMAKQISEYQGEVPIENIQPFVNAGSVGTIVGCIFGCVFTLGLAVFYFWARSYMGKPRLDSHFTS